MEMVHFIPTGQRRLAMLAAQADTAPALISGASGTGKGAIARWIHSNSPRAAHPFIIATRDRTFIEQISEAQGGTIVIPEIGEWPWVSKRPSWASSRPNPCLIRAIPRCRCSSTSA